MAQESAENRRRGTGTNGNPSGVNGGSDSGRVFFLSGIYERSVVTDELINLMQRLNVVVMKKGFVVFRVVNLMDGHCDL